MDLLAQTYEYTTTTDSSMNPIVVLAYIAFAVLAIVGMWKVFTKAGQPGWASIIPFYNTYVLLKIVNREPWWLILYFIPFVNLIVSIVVMNDLAKAFGKSTGFTVLLVLLPFIALPILGLGDAKYTKPAARS